MFFSFLSFSLIFSVDFSLQTDDGQSKSQDNSKQESNEMNKVENVIKKSDLEELLQLKNQYLVKNCIEEFEIHHAINFVPNWSNVYEYTFDSSARQSIEIRRQKWNFIFDKFANSVAVNRLNSEIKKAGINQTTFCNDIAEIYFTLSDNTFIFDKERNSENKPKTFPFVRNPSQEKSILVFMNSIYNFENNKDNKNEDTVRIPKELYVKLIRKDAHGAMMQHHHNDKIQRIKKAYRLRAHVARHAKHVDSELSSY